MGVQSKDLVVGHNYYYNSKKTLLTFVKYENEYPYFTQQGACEYLEDAEGLVGFVKEATFTKAFKKGDRCRITGNSNLHGFEIGEEVEIEGESSQFGRGYKAWHLDRRNWWWVSPKDMELITEDSPDLTLMQKFEDGWIFTHRDGTTVTDMGVMKSGKIAVIWSDGVSNIVGNEREILRYHTITPPAPKVKKRFAPIYTIADDVVAGNDYETLDDAKKDIASRTTCILEHHKVDGKWVFVKVHNV